MELGDVASAQKIYYELLEEGHSNKDTSKIFNSLYSLGQLYAGEEDYESAIKHFLSIIELKKTYKGRASNYVLTDYELSQAYMNSGQDDKALEVIKSGLVYLEQNKIDRLKPDFLVLEGRIALDNNDLYTAQRIYQEVAPLAIKNNDRYTTESVSYTHLTLPTILLV